MIKKIKSFVFKLLMWFFGLSVVSVFVFKYVPVPFTPLMGVRAIENHFANKPIVFKHDWQPIENLSMNLQKAVVCSEDGTFLYHYGFDFSAMQEAYENNVKKRNIKGGSTISQQTAKNVFLWQGRSYFRKIAEAYFTVLIEVIWGKKRIMEVYLNSIEMGDGIYGAQAATQYWYRKDASNLTKIEAAGIAAILPNPRKYKADNSSAYINKRKKRILKIMSRRGRLIYP